MEVWLSSLAVKRDCSKAKYISDSACSVKSAWGICRAESLTVKAIKLVWLESSWCGVVVSFPFVDVSSEISDGECVAREMGLVHTIEDVLHP